MSGAVDIEHWMSVASAEEWATLVFHHESFYPERRVFLSKTTLRHAILHACWRVV